MFQIIILNLLLTLPSLALAQAPVHQVDGQCPTGYRPSGDFCTPISSGNGDKQQVVEKKGGSCPPGFQSSGPAHCKQMWNSDAEAVTKSGSTCPTGYRKSGDYCKPINAATPANNYSIEKIGHSCPPGFTVSGDYCKRLSNSTSEALPRQDGSQCPMGYRSTGDYCVKI